MSPDNLNDIEGHVAQALEFLKRGRDYLAADDLHQASEKGWGSAAHMAKAVALAQRWQYEQHSHFHRIMNQAARLSDSNRLPSLHGRAEILHANLYELGQDLDADRIREDLNSIAELLDLLEPLTKAAMDT